MRCCLLRKGCIDARKCERLIYFSAANAPASDRKDLLSELELMKKLKSHPHVIRLIGCVTESGNVNTFHGATHLRILISFHDYLNVNLTPQTPKFKHNESFPVERQRSSDTKKCEYA